MKTSLHRNTPAGSTSGFTIVEILIVIVVIGILAAIVIVAYNGIQGRATETVLKSDLSGAAKQLAMDKTLTDSYPSTVNPDGSGDANQSKGLTASDGTSYEYTSDGASFCLSATRGGQGLHVTQSGTPKDGVCEGHSEPVADGGDGDGSSLDGITIGSQTWAATNLNVGTMDEQADDSIVQKYCYDDEESNCATYGGLYQWTEAMQGSTSQGAQGICPAGWHIPTDEEWTILEEELGMTPEQADADPGFRGDHTSQLLPDGSSGLDLPLAGYRHTDSSFQNLDARAVLWSSSESGGEAWDRDLHSGMDGVYRGTGSQTFAFSVRCLKN